MGKSTSKTFKSKARYFIEGGDWDVGEDEDVTKNNADNLPSDKFEWEKKL